MVIVMVFAFGRYSSGTDRGKFCITMVSNLLVATDETEATARPCSVAIRRRRTVTFLGLVMSHERQLGEDGEEEESTGGVMSIDGFDGIFTSVLTLG